MNEDGQSPWGLQSFPVPEFVRLPVLNPKTGESPCYQSVFCVVLWLSIELSMQHGIINSITKSLN